MNKHTEVPCEQRLKKQAWVPAGSCLKTRECAGYSSKRRRTPHPQIRQTTPANCRRSLFKSYFITEVILYVLKFSTAHRHRSSIVAIAQQATLFDSRNSSQAPLFDSRNSSSGLLFPSIVHHKTAKIQYSNIEYALVLLMDTYAIIVGTNCFEMA